ncbi:MAG: hypothetical protein BJ554DRAFT_3957 [Olpidium bornovanus]|uniref:Uncharacterized protein n=1 Tax=Olpidium bornovanus TaxID=278681 RepID=A0A8H7ZNP5_9FUNG|nr:MAG: hypothetical protein BJ554DRAFT_3957 [Olpidium bornovanus]
MAAREENKTKGCYPRYDEVEKGKIRRCLAMILRATRGFAALPDKQLSTGLHVRSSLFNSKHSQAYQGILASRPEALIPV